MNLMIEVSYSEAVTTHPTHNQLGIKDRESKIESLGRVNLASPCLIVSKHIDLKLPLRIDHWLCEHTDPNGKTG